MQCSAMQCNGRHLLAFCRRRARQDAGSDSGQEGESDEEEEEEDEGLSSPRDGPEPRDCVIS